MRSRLEILALIPRDDIGEIPNARMRELAFMLEHVAGIESVLPLIEAEVLAARVKLEAGIRRRERFFKAMASKYL